MTYSLTAEKSAPVRRRALVTGASSGIGAAFAARLAREGADVTLVARSRERLDALAQRIRGGGTSAEVVVADLREAGDVETLVARLAADPPDVLVNNAGFGTFGSFAELDPVREEEEIRVNIVALMRLTRAALPGMLARNSGAIVNVSSIAAFQPGPFTATYSASKAWVSSFTEAITEELRGTNVCVQALCPGFTRTEFQDRAGIDTGSIPGVAWMSADDVVDASLASLRRREAVCVPGMANRMVVTLTGVVPRAWLRRVAGTMGRRFRSTVPTST
jgi:short-subunit dehydrogenase